MLEEDFILKGEGMGMGRERVRESKQTEKKHVMVIRDCVSGARALRNLVLGRESRNWRQFVRWGGTSTTLLLLLPSFLITNTNG